MNDWRPIETLELRYGRRVLVFPFSPQNRVSEAVVGYTVDALIALNNGLPDPENKIALKSIGSNRVLKGITHWMPIPSPPGSNAPSRPTPWITNGLVPTPLLSSMGDYNRPMSAARVDAKQADVLHRSHLASVEVIKQPVVADRLNIKVLPGNKISRADAGKMFDRSPKTMAMWAASGWGPRCINVGGRIFHDYDECLAMARGEKSVKP